MSNINMNTLKDIGEEVSKAAEFLQKEFPKMPLDVAYQLAAMARQERGQTAMHKREQEVAKYSADKLSAILNQLRELAELQYKNNSATEAISRQIHR